MEINTNLPTSFWDNVFRSPNCWEWQGRKNKRVNGYGWFYYQGKQQLAHRLVCKDIPPGACVLHRCDNPACVNPDHLFFGSKADNAQDAVSKNRDAAFKTAKLTHEAVRELRDLPRTVEVAREYAARYGVSLSSINQVQNHHTWKRVDTGPKKPFKPVPRVGEMAGNVKITEEDVHAIRREYKGYGDGTRLARRHGLTPGAIQAIVTNKRWSHLPWEEGVVPHVPRSPKEAHPPKPPPAPKAPKARKLSPQRKRLERMARRRAKRAHLSP